MKKIKPINPIKLNEVKATLTLLGLRSIKGTKDVIWINPNNKSVYSAYVYIINKATIQFKQKEYSENEISEFFRVLTSEIKEMTND